MKTTAKTFIPWLMLALLMYVVAKNVQSCNDYQTQNNFNHGKYMAVSQ